MQAPSLFEIVLGGGVIYGIRKQLVKRREWRRKMSGLRTDGDADLAQQEATKNDRQRVIVKRILSVDGGDGK